MSNSEYYEEIKIAEHIFSVCISEDALTNAVKNPDDYNDLKSNILTAIKVGIARGKILAFKHRRIEFGEDTGTD